jgi:hypothetical protein
MLFAVSDVVWQALIAAVVTIVLTAMQQRNANRAAKEAAEVKSDLLVHTAETRDAIAENTAITKVTHDLVNSESLEQRRQKVEDKKLILALVKQVAVFMKDASTIPAAEEAVREAEELYHKHLIKQNAVDAKANKTTG